MMIIKPKAAFSYIHFSEYVKKYKVDTTNVLLGGNNFGGGMGLT
jgi:hypothetical protein